MLARRSLPEPQGYCSAVASCMQLPKPGLSGIGILACSFRSPRCECFFQRGLVFCPGRSTYNSPPLADARGSVLSAVCTESRPSGSRELFCPNLWSRRAALPDYAARLPDDKGDTGGYRVFDLPAFSAEHTKGSHVNRSLPPAIFFAAL